MLSDYDVFYAASDRYQTLTSGGQATTSGSPTLVGDRYTFTLTAAPNAEWELGQIVRVFKPSSFDYANFRVVARTTSPQTVTLVPVRSRDDVVIPSASAFGNGSTVTGQNVFTDVLTLVIDLSEATGLASFYNYVFAASCACTAGPTTAVATSIRVTSNAQADDPLWGATTIGDATHTPTTGSYLGTNFANFVWYALQLTPGQRYEYRILVSSTSTTGIARAEHPRIVALRTDSLVVQEQVSEVTTTNTSAYANILSDSQKSVTTAGTYLVLGSWMQTLSANGAANQGTVRFRRLGSVTSAFTTATWSPTAANEYRAGGYVSVETLSSGDYLNLAHIVVSGGSAGLTSKVKNARILIAKLPDSIVDAFTQKIANGTSATLDAEAWQDLVTSSSFTAAQTQAGTWIDFIHTGNAATQNLRPRFDSTVDADWEMRGNGLIEQPAGVGTREFGNFWFHRVERDAVGPTNAIQVRPSTAGTQSYTTCVFTFLRAAPAVRVTDGVPRLVAAEIESGVVLKKQWSAGNSGVYTRPCPEFELVTRVIVNGTELTRYATSAEATAGANRWHWDLTAKVLTIRISSITYNGVTYDDPSSDYIHVMVVAPYLVTRDGDVVLTDNWGITRQYEARLATVPTISQELAVQSEGCEVGTSFGQVSLAAADGAFDGAFSQRIFDGLGIRVYRGRTGIDTLIRRMVPVVTANLGVPNMSMDTLSIDVYDGSLILKRRVSTKMVAAYHGESRTTDISGNPVNDTILPRVYGVLRRVPAYRTAVNGTTDSTFTICDITFGALTKIGILNEDTGAFDNTKCVFDAEKWSSTITISNVSLSAATFKVTAVASADHYRDDVLYVDVAGAVTDSSDWYSDVGSGVLIASPGLIMLDLLRRAGVPIESVDRQSFRLLDRKWRTRRTTDGTTSLPLEMGFAFYEETAAEALTTVARHAFAFWGQTRTGRYRAGVPEIEAQNLLGNPGFETSSTVIHPWQLAAGASSTMSTSTKYYGARALQISNDKSGALIQRVIFPRAGQYAVTALLSAQTGDASFVRLAVVKPGNGFARALSDTFEVPSTRWTRASMLVEIGEGEAGTGIIEVLPCLPTQFRPAYPPLYQSIEVWLRPEELVGETGAAVSVWPSVTGIGMDAAAGAVAPILINDAVAGHPALYFREGQTSMSIFPNFTGEACCIFIVAMLRTDGFFSQRNLITGAANDAGIAIGINKGFFTHYWSARVKASTYLDATSVTVREFVPVILMLRKTAQDVSRLWVNGVAQGSNNTTAGQLTLTGRDWYLGAEPSSPNATDLNAGGFYIAEVMIYNTGLSTDTRIPAIHEYLQAKYGVQDVSLNIDNVEVVPTSVAVLASDGADTHARNAAVQSYETRQEHFFEASVPLNRFIARPDFNVKRIVATDNEARGVQSSYDSSISEALATLQTAGRLSIENDEAGGISSLTATDGAQSAAAVANALALRFSRQGSQAVINLFDFERMPEVGELLFHESVKRISPTASDYPIWQVLKVSDASPAATEIELVVERPIDPVLDRSVIVPAEIPVNGIVLVIASGQSCPTDYTEVTEMRGFYAAGLNGTPSLTAESGYVAHQHTLSHAHVVATHTHTATMASTTSLGKRLYTDSGGELSDIMRVTGTGGTTFVYGANTGHTHSVSSTNFTAGAPTSTTSLAPVSTPTSFYGTNSVKHRRVLFCRRTAKTQSTINSSIVMGYKPAGNPSGWKPCDGTSSTTDMVGYALRGAGPIGAISKTTAASLTQSDAGTIVALTNLTTNDYVTIYDRVTVTNGASSFSGVIGAIDLVAKNITIYPLHETGDTANGTVYASGSTVTIASQLVGQTFTPADHKHVASGTGGVSDMAAHTHTNTHLHPSITGTPPSISSSSTPAKGDYAGPYLSYATTVNVLAGHSHGGSMTSTGFQAQTTASSSAGGTITSATQNSPDTLKLCFITPTSGNETSVPAGCVMFYSGAACPAGWSAIKEANDRLIIGDTSASGMTTVTGSHTHTFTAQAHTNSHTHPASTAYTPAEYEGPTYFQLNGAGSDAVTATERAQSYWTGHLHSVPVSSVSTTDGPLTEASATSSAAEGTLTLPKSRRLLLCVKT